MQRRPRIILLFLLIVAPISPARGDDTLATLAHRFTEPGQVEPVADGGSAAAIESREAQPLGPADPAASKSLSSRNNPAALTTGSWVMDTLTSLGLVLGLVLAARWAYARFLGRAPASRVCPVVEVLARSTVAPRNHVLLLRVGSRVLVVSDSAGGMRTLADIDDPEEVASLIGAVSVTRDNSITKNFTRLFASFNGQYDRHSADLEGNDENEHRVDRARDSISNLLSRVRVLSDRGGAS